MFALDAALRNYAREDMLSWFRRWGAKFAEILFYEVG
jgi:hypothetical protein